MLSQPNLKSTALIGVIIALLSISIHTNAFAATTARNADQGAGAGSTTKPSADVDKDLPPGALSPEALIAMLEPMGYEIQKKKTDKGDPYCWLNYKMDSWDFNFEVSVSGDRTRIWILSSLGEPLDLDKIPSAALINLLAENDTIGPTHFYLRKTSRRLYIATPVENRDVTPRKMRAEIDRLMTTIKRTEPLWKPSKWTSAAPAH